MGRRIRDDVNKASVEIEGRIEKSEPANHCQVEKLVQEILEQSAFADSLVDSADADVLKLEEDTHLDKIRTIEKYIMD